MSKMAWLRGGFRMSPSRPCANCLVRTCPRDSGHMLLKMLSTSSTVVRPPHSKTRLHLRPGQENARTSNTYTHLVKQDMCIFHQRPVRNGLKNLDHADYLATHNDQGTTSYGTQNDA